MIRLLFLTFCALSTGLLAQEDGRPILFRVVCFEMAPGERDLLACGNPAGAEGVKIHLGRRLESTVHKLKVLDGVVRIGTPATTPDGKTLIAPSALVKLPAKGSQFLFLLVPNGKKTGLVYHCMVLVDDRRTFPPGGFRFVNFTKKKLRFMLQKQPIQLRPGGQRIVAEIKGAREDGRFPYVAQYFDTDAWNRLSTGYWYTHPKIRSLQVAYVNPQTKRLSLKSYDDKLFMRSSEPAKQ